MAGSTDHDQVLRTLQAELPYLRERYGVTRLALYGSFARDTAGADSDVDLLVELSRPLGLEFVVMTDYLEERLGREVDLATFETLNRSRSNPRYRNIVRDVERTLTDVRAAA